MGHSVGSIESVSGEHPAQLIAALRGLGSFARVFSVADLRTSAETPRVDICAASARVPPAELSDIMVRFSDYQPAPEVLIFTDTEFDYLEQHVRHGRDYIVPPFIPSLLSVRLLGCDARAGPRRQTAQKRAACALLAG